MNRRDFIRGALGLAGAAVVGTVTIKGVSDSVAPDLMQEVSDTWYSEAIDGGAASLAENIRKIFDLLVGPYDGDLPEDTDDWDDKDWMEWASDKPSILDVEFPPLTQERIDECLTEMEETSGKMMAWLRAKNEAI